MQISRVKWPTIIVELQILQIAMKRSTQAQLSRKNNTLHACYTARTYLRGRDPEAIRAVAMLLRNAYVCLIVANAQALQKPDAEILVLEHSQWRTCAQLPLAEEPQSLRVNLRVVVEALYGGASPILHQSKSDGKKRLCGGLLNILLRA